VFASQASVLHNLAHQVGHVAQAGVQPSISTELLGNITVFERKGCLWGDWEFSNQGQKGDWG
jgi:hypothetical protein